MVFSSAPVVPFSGCRGPTAFSWVSISTIRPICSVQTARDRLGAYLFEGEDVFKPVSALSGGEQSRLRLCMLMDEKINLLILDEPTNHLDVASREWIEEAVEAYDGTLLFVSHDRYFINRFATRIWELADGTITDYTCGFAQYRQLKAQEAVERCRGELERYKVWRQEEVERRYDAIMGKGLSLKELDVFKAGLGALADGELKLEEAIAQALENVKKRQEDVRKAREAARQAQHETAKIVTHRDIWLVEAKREAERLEDLEMEEFKPLPPQGTEGEL